MNNNKTTNIQNKGNEKFNAFIDMMAQLIKKYGKKVLVDTVTKTEKNDEARR